MSDAPGRKRHPVARKVDRKKVGPLTFVEWVDHCSSCDTGWQSFEELRENKPLLVWSSGWLIHETKQYITLASTIGSNGHAFGDLIILKKCITKRENLGRAQI